VTVDRPALAPPPRRITLASSDRPGPLSFALSARSIARQQRPEEVLRDFVATTPNGTTEPEEVEDHRVSGLEGPVTATTR